jgi:hypothetical protein
MNCPCTLSIIYEHCTVPAPLGTLPVRYISPQSRCYYCVDRALSNSPQGLVRRSAPPAAAALGLAQPSPLRAVAAVNTDARALAVVVVAAVGGRLSALATTPSDTVSPGKQLMAFSSVL